MDRGRNSSASRRDFRRIGRKALASGRTIALLETRASAAKSRKWEYSFKRWHALVPLAMILLIGGVWGSQTFIHAQQAAKAQATAAAETARAQSVAEKAEACRQAKVQENAATIATMTYDQLYGTSCNF